MPNLYKNKVVYGNTTIIDISDTTAVASDVASGKYFYLASGEKVQGTASAGTGMTVVETQDEHGGTIVTITGEEVRLQSKSATPSESAQTIQPDNGYTGLSQVSVVAISSSYVGSGITRRDVDDIEIYGKDVNVPAGYYASDSSVGVEEGSAGTPTASKGSVSNHSISVTPSVTNTTGYITGGTKSGAAVTVSASELVSGTYTVDSSGTKDVTNYASASVAAGTAGTPSASKGTVSNHSVSVTPSVTNTTGWITGSTKTGTAVTVSASELVSGSETKTANGTYNVTNLASLVVAVPIVTYYTGSGTPSASLGQNGDIYLQTS